MIKKIFQECIQGNALENRDALLGILEELCMPKTGGKEDKPYTASYKDDSCLSQGGPLVKANESLYLFWNGVNRQDKSKYALAVQGFFATPVIAEVVDNLETLDEKNCKEDLDSLCEACEAQIQVYGYVYAAWNPLFQDLIKIGATTRMPHIRVAELGSAGVPEPFELVSSIRSKNPFKLEKSIHDHFASIRKYGKRKEFFTLSKSDVSDYFQSLQAGDLHEPLGIPPMSKGSEKRKWVQKEDSIPVPRSMRARP